MAAIASVMRPIKALTASLSIRIDIRFMDIVIIASPF
jgi:hypothetical protein